MYGAHIMAQATKFLFLDAIPFSTFINFFSTFLNIMAIFGF